MTRTLAALVLAALWLGAALLAVTVVAPGAFAVLPTRALAGDMVGRVLPVLFAGAIAVPALVLLIAPAARRSGLARFSAVVSAAAAAAALWVVDPRIAALRAAAVVPIDQLAPADPRRAMFGVLHAGSVALLGLAMIAVAVLLLLLARDVAPPGAPKVPESR
ncbi:MAG: DUF4149 domain-containing protein [Gemmatimonadetes bacterium]|nr:DUF4149 domain-containing protein [Gemmatimonadota bacterium]